MTEKKYRVHDWVKFDYSEIGEYIDENHTDRPLRNDEVVELLNELHEENEYLKKRLNNVERELFCKDRILEEKGTDIECCDEKDCGYCKHCQLDGMFGMWCDIHDDKFFHNVSVCSDFKR